MSTIRKVLHIRSANPQVQVNRERVDVQKLRSNMRVIDKDVPRTDRDQDYFRLLLAAIVVVVGCCCCCCCSSSSSSLGINHGSKIAFHLEIRLLFNKTSYTFYKRLKHLLVLNVFVV